MREQGREIIMIGDHGHPEVEGTMGQSQGMYLVETAADVTRLRVGDENNLAFVTQTTLSVDDASRIHRGAESALSENRGTQDRRYLLRDAKSAGCDQGLRAAMRRRDCRRLAQQLQLQPAARSRRQPGRDRLYGRQCTRVVARVGSRQGAHPRHRRRFGTGSAGAGSGYAPERIGRERSVGVVRHHRTRDFPVAEESVSRSILIRFGCRALKSGISQCP
jgi:hypothetical protein